MLALPDKGVRQSTAAHNVDLSMFVDWLEASAIVDQDEISFSSIVDVLLEEQKYAKQDFAWDLIELATREIERRLHALGDGYPFSLKKKRLKPRKTLKERPDYGYCLEVSLCSFYQPVKAPKPKEIQIRGLLMEQLAGSALTEMLPRWTIFITGWSKQKPIKFHQTAARVAELLWSAIKDDNLFKERNEAGLDILCFRGFGDRNGGFQSLMVQCATGSSDWEKKRKEPDLAIWRNAVELPVVPTRALALPFALDERRFKESTIIVEGPVLDRFRILEPSKRGMEWLSAEMNDDLFNWCKARWPLYPRSEIDA